MKLGINLATNWLPIISVVTSIPTVPLPLPFHQLPNLTDTLPLPNDLDLNLGSNLDIDLDVVTVSLLAQLIRYRCPMNCPTVYQLGAQ